MINKGNTNGKALTAGIAVMVKATLREMNLRFGFKAGTDFRKDRSAQ